MRFVASFIQDNWQKRIEAVTDGRKLFTNNYDIDPSFPLDEVRNITTQYIVGKKERAVRGVNDDRLIKLIIRCERVGVGFVACTHLLSQQAIRTLVVRDFVHLRKDVYLSLLLLAHHGNPNAVDELEYIRAKGLLLAFSQESSALVDGLYMRLLVELSITTPVPETSLIHATLQTALISICPMISHHLRGKLYVQDWEECWKLMSWTSHLREPGQHFPVNCLNPIEILDQNLSQWRMWAAWQPLRRWTSTSMQKWKKNRLDFATLLALDGPDEKSPPMANNCERLLTGNITIENGPVAVFDRGNLRLCLCESSEDEARQRMRRLHEYVSLMMCRDTRNDGFLGSLLLKRDVTVDEQELLQAVAEAKNDKLTSDLLELRICQMDVPAQRNLSAALIRDLDLDGRKDVKESALGKYAVSTLTTIILQHQLEYKNALAGKSAMGLPICEIRLQTSMSHLQGLCEGRDWVSQHMEKSICDLVLNAPRLSAYQAIQQLRNDLSSLKGKPAISISAKLEKYLQHLFLTRGCVDAEDVLIFEALLQFWSAERSLPTQALALILADGKGKFRAHCISNLQSLTNAQAMILLDVMKNWSGNTEAQDHVCVELTEFLATKASDGERQTDGIVPVWKPVLYRMLKARGAALIGNLQGTLKSLSYVKFMQNVQTIFGDKIVWNVRLSPPIMNPSLYGWVNRLALYSSVLARLDSNDRTSMIPCLLAGSDPWYLEGILCHLHAIEDTRLLSPFVSRVCYAIAERLTISNTAYIYDLVCSVTQISFEGIAACARILDLMPSLDLASTMLSIWLQEPSWSDIDRSVLKDVALLLGVQVIESLSDTSLSAFAEYIETRYQGLLAEAKRLDYMRMDLKSRDHDGVVELLNEMTIENTSSMEDAFARLPVALLNVMEKVDDDQIEILFPLHDLTALQRAALGVGDAQNLILRLYVGDSCQTKFCIHLDNEASLNSSEIHSQWTVFKTTRAPEDQICHGIITPVTYQLARVLTRYLVNGFKDLLSVHTLVTTSLKTMASSCIVCGKLHGVALRRATICDTLECSIVFARSPVEIRLSAIRQDPLAIDMLIRMIHSAIQSGHHNLLSDCPLDKDACLEVMRRLPSMEKLAKSKYFSVTIRNLPAGKADRFLTWVCCSFKGFLATASGKLRIPSLPPGTLQFVLANASPIKELGFHTDFNDNTQLSKVVFHGTSLDRLYPILHQGLKIMSGTALQAYGAASGAGIYLADEPSTSWIYTNHASTTRANWSRSAIKSGRILLGCELTGTSTAGRSGIHVITKESSVMVRYIFVVPPETTVLPIANHLTSSMMSVFNSLRSGAL